MAEKDRFEAIEKRLDKLEEHKPADAPKKPEAHFCDVASGDLHNMTPMEITFDRVHRSLKARAECLNCSFVFGDSFALKELINPNDLREWLEYIGV